MVAPDITARLKSTGIEFADLDDAVKAVMKITTDTSVNGKMLCKQSNDPLLIVGFRTNVLCCQQV